MTNKEAIEFLKNMIGEKSASTIGKEGFYVDLMGYHVEALKLAIKALENKPLFLARSDGTIEPIRKKGKWIKEVKPFGGFGDGVLVRTCSECGEGFVYHEYIPNFCPNCGADMREGEIND